MPTVFVDQIPPRQAATSFFSFFSFFLRFDMVVVHVQLQLQLLLLFSSVALSLRIMIALARNNIAPVFHFFLSPFRLWNSFIFCQSSLSFYSILHSFSFSLSPFHSISLEWSKLICHILKSHRRFLRRVLYEFC